MYHKQIAAHIMVDEGIVNTVNWLNNYKRGYVARTLFSCQGDRFSPYITWVSASCTDYLKNHDKEMDEILERLAPYGKLEERPGQFNGVGISTVYCFRFKSKRALRQLEKELENEINQQYTSQNLVVN